MKFSFKLFKAINAQNRVNQSAFDYQVIVIDTWVQAFEAWMNKLVFLAKEGKTINTLRELITLWNEVAEGVFLNVFHSEKYIRVQGDFLNAQMQYRIQKREVVELLQIGSIAITKVSAAVMANFSPDYKVLGVPYLFRDKKHLFANRSKHFLFVNCCN